MPSSQLKPPAPDELEVSVFGPGYGESIVLHVGDGQWVLVDSCLHPSSGKPAPLEYLHSLNVDVTQSVRLVVATHWHDDHVRGIRSVVSECKTAKLFISSALDAQDFFKLVQLYSREDMLKSSGLDEFTAIFRVLDWRRETRARLNPPGWASQDRLLYRHEIPLASGMVEAKVFSLSPSDSAILQAKLAFARLLPAIGEGKKRMTSPAPNHASVVLWIEVADHKVLLGADLERTSGTNTGWSVILDDSTVVSANVSVFKVPHHGAESAHDPRVWSELLSANPLAVLTPFSRGNNVLPTTEDVQRIAKLTPKIYITAPPETRRHRWTNRVVRDSVSGATRDMHNTHCGWGHVRLRRSLTGNSTLWRPELFGDALELSSEASPN